MVEGSKLFCFNKRYVVMVSEVSLIIRFPIPKAAFEVDFFILLSPNMKKDFILVLGMRSLLELITEQK